MQIETSMIQADLNALCQWSVDFNCVLILANVQFYTLVSSIRVNCIQLTKIIFQQNLEKDLGVGLSTNLKFTIDVISAVKKVECALAVLQ